MPTGLTSLHSKHNSLENIDQNALNASVETATTGVPTSNGTSAPAELAGATQSSDGAPSLDRPRSISITGERPSVVFDLAPPTRDTGSIARLYSLEADYEGILCRPGRFFKGNWKEVFAIVTKSGFLHYFEEKTLLFPDTTIPLIDSLVSISATVAPSGTGIDIVCPSTSRFMTAQSAIHTFRTGTPAEAGPWIAAIQRNVAISPPITATTQLQQPAVTPTNKAAK